ncbi:MAG: glycosyltransferase family 9 protein [Planctomycetota bacterium]|jgi:ADP-heptose:LPS heptosyltransferase
MNEKTLVVVRNGALGDVLVLRPALLALRRLRPEWRVILLAPGERGRLLAPEVEQVIDVERAKVAPLFGGEIPEEAWLRGALQGANAALLFMDENQALVQALTGVGIDPVVFVPAHPAEGSGIHAAEHLWRGVAQIVGCDDPLPRLDAPLRGDPDGARSVFPAGHESYTVVHPGSGSLNKNAPLDRFVQRMEAWNREGLTNQLIVSGEADGTLGEDLASRVSWARRVPSLSLPQLAGLLNGATAYLGNDSGVSHLAAACGVPVTVFFRSTDSTLWRPWGERVEVIADG